MTWTEKMKEWGGANVTFLSEDGEVINFVVVGEPVLLESKFKGNIQERIAAPIVTLEGFTLYIMGKRLARRLSKHEEQFGDTAFTVIRHGEAGDIDSTYELRICDIKDLTDALFEYRDMDFNESMIDEALEDAREILKG